MLLHELVEATARDAGAWGHERGRKREWFLYDWDPRDDGVAWAQRSEPTHRISWMTALVLLLGERELTVDFGWGSCPACRARSGTRRRLAMWEWRQKLIGRGPLSLPGERMVLLDVRPCPACTVDGKPTGHRVVPWATAIEEAEGIIGLDAIAAREAISVVADKLQADGDKLGCLIALWLAGEHGQAEQLAESW